MREVFSCGMFGPLLVKDTLRAHIETLTKVEGIGQTEAIARGGTGATVRM